MTRTEVITVAAALTVFVIGYRGITSGKTRSLLADLEAQGSSQGLVLASGSGWGTVEVHRTGWEGSKLINLGKPMSARAFAPGGRGLAGKLHNPGPIDINRRDEAVVLMASGEVVDQFPLPESSGQPRFGLSADLKSVAVCGRFPQGKGLQTYRGGKPATFFPIARIDDHAYNCGQVTWSPEAQRVAVEVDGEILLAEVASGKLELWRKGTLPSWSPDGRLIAYRPPSGGIAVSAVDRSTERHLVWDSGVEGFLAWSPDGQYLAFAKPTILMIGGGHYVCRVRDGVVVRVQWPAPIKGNVGIPVGWYYADRLLQARAR